jgi:hypothetical protein
MDELKSVREILEELAAGDDRLRESFPQWCAELDRRRAGSAAKKPPRRETNPTDSEDRDRTAAAGE